MMRLLEAFGDTFSGRQYLHRDQTRGNFVACHLYDDLVSLGRSQKISSGISAGQLVVNTANIVKGRKGRRGDGTFGELVPGEQPVAETGFLVSRGPIASVLIGAEMKILAKAMIKQIDRVITDLREQASVFRKQTPHAITVGIVAVNHAAAYTSYEGDRTYPAKPVPAKEAPEATRRLISLAAPSFDEFIVLPFKAANTPPYPFTWVDLASLRQEYNAALLRISRLFEDRF